MLGTIPGQRRRGRPRMSRLDNITAWTQSTLENTLRNTENRDQWRWTVHSILGSRKTEGKARQGKAFYIVQR